MGALRVDGKVYRFLGKDKINLVPIAPMTNVNVGKQRTLTANHQTDGKNFSLMIAIGRKVKQRLVVVIWNVFTQNGKETIPISTFVALSILMNRISLKIFI
nr:hypothetical protein [Bacteroides thetaiotaomicron]